MFGGESAFGEQTKVERDVQRRGGGIQATRRGHGCRPPDVAGVARQGVVTGGWLVSG